jgi:hypothetical protein
MTERESNYLTQDFKMEFLPNRTPFLHTTITPYFEELLDRMSGYGLTLFTNVQRLCPKYNLIKTISRDGNMVTVTINGEADVKNVKFTDADVQDAVSGYFNTIFDSIEKYAFIAEFSEELYPIYMSGLVEIPEAILGIVKESFISKDKNYNHYSIMFTQDAFERYIYPHKKYFNYIATKIMDADKASYYDKGYTMFISDKVSHYDTSIDRSIALTNAIVFGLFGIVNMQNQ